MTTTTNLFHWEVRDEACLIPGKSDYSCPPLPLEWSPLAVTLPGKDLQSRTKLFVATLGCNLQWVMQCTTPLRATFNNHVSTAMPPASKGQKSHLSF